MEEKNGWSSETNWSVIQGDLRKTVLLEIETSTSLLLRADEKPTAVEPLLLKPSRSPELGPCEITVKFSQKHEIHKVYLRSTARVYEIYYATEQQGGNEYLYTSRCVPVKRKCHPFQSDCSSISASSEGTKNDHSDEDGWVDVKVPGFVLPSEAYPSSRTSETKKQEENCCFYEGTAEICGTSPCIYLTVRLLSLYTKGSVCLDQLYILASPTASSVEPANPAVSSGNASLLAMLVPSLIQLSRVGSEAQGRPSSGSMKLCNGSDMETERRIQTEKPVEVIGNVEQLQQSSGDAKACIGWSARGEGQSNRVKDEICGSGAAICTGANTKEESESVMSNGSNGEHRGSTSCSCRCEALIKLNEKIDRIVAHCASIEDNMFKPLVSMETRLKQLEEKLDAFFTSELNRHANFSLDGSHSERYDGIEKDGCQSRKKTVVVRDRFKCSNCNGFDDESATEDDIGSDSEDTSCSCSCSDSGSDSEYTSCSCSCSDSSSDSNEDDLSEDEDVGSDDIEENESELDEQNNLASVSSDLSCMSCNIDGKNYSITDDDYAEEDGETEAHASDGNDDIEENVKDPLGSANALNTMTPLSVKSKRSIEEALVSALSDFVATTAAADNGSYSERASVTSMNIIDKESWRPVVTEAIFSSQSTDESLLLACGGTACQDQLVATGLDSSSSTLKRSNELQLDGVQEDQGDSGIQSEESLKLKPDVEPFVLNQNLEKGFEILNHIKEQNQQFKNTFKYKPNSEDFEDSFLDVKFAVDKNCQSDFSLEVLLGGEDLATKTCLSNGMLKLCNDDHLLSLEEDPTSVMDCVESSCNQIDNFSMPEELKQVGPVLEGWRETTTNDVDCLAKNIDLLCSEDVLQTDPVSNGGS